MSENPSEIFLILRRNSQTAPQRASESGVESSAIQVLNSRRSLSPSRDCLRIPSENLKNLRRILRHVFKFSDGFSDMFLNSQTDCLRIYYLGIWEPGRNSENFFRNLRMIPGMI